MLIHTVIFWLKEGLNEDDRKQFFDGVEKLGLIGKEKAIACEVIISIIKYD